MEKSTEPSIQRKWGSLLSRLFPSKSSNKMFSSNSSSSMRSKLYQPSVLASTLFGTRTIFKPAITITSFTNTVMGALCKMLLRGRALSLKKRH